MTDYRIPTGKDEPSRYERYSDPDFTDAPNDPEEQVRMLREAWSKHVDLAELERVARAGRTRTGGTDG